MGSLGFGLEECLKVPWTLETNRTMWSHKDRRDFLNSLQVFPPPDLDISIVCTAL